MIVLPRMRAPGSLSSVTRGPVVTELTLVARARAHAERTAIVAAEGTFTYRDLLDASARVATCLLDGHDDLEEARVAFLVPPGFQYVAVQWGIWRAGGVAVPLAVSHPPAELEYVIRDAEAAIVVVHPEFAAVISALRLPPDRRTVTTEQAVSTSPLSHLPKVVKAIRAAKDPLTLKNLPVTGDDLIAAGVRPGPEVGETLQRLLAEVLEDPRRNTKAYLLSRV